MSTTESTTRPTDLGLNRTGIEASPLDSKKTVEGARNAGPEAGPAGAGSGDALTRERTAWCQNAGPVGTLPPPASIKGAVKTVLQKLKGVEPNVFLDKLGERLAFERTGVRLYEALLCKLEGATVHEGGPTRQELLDHRIEELAHFHLLEDAMRELGADPTAMTPCADIVAVASSGAVKVLADPRSTLTQCLDAMLMVELLDNDSWEVLARLAEGLRQDDLAARFRAALADEERHLRAVRRWLGAALLGQAGVQPTAPRRGPSA